MSDGMTTATHARTELERAGWLTEENRQSGEALLAAATAFAEGGWSGGSVSCGVEILRLLCLHQPLGPLTDDPAEWFHHGEDVTGQHLWQSTRRSSCFSNDGGRTFYDLDERTDGELRFHQAQPVREAEGAS